MCVDTHLMWLVKAFPGSHSSVSRKIPFPVAAAGHTSTLGDKHPIGGQTHPANPNTDASGERGATL